MEVTPQPVRPFAHVPALDGLRGLLLVPVLAYHADPSWFPGAMVAITAFFTLSGFLITTLIIRELESTGRLSLRGFWTRRARRLVPASIAAVVLIVGLVAAGALAGTGLVADAASALTWSANWHFIADGASYASLFRDPSPFQHFWSLAVEEQVYLIVPVAALLLLGRSARHKTRFALFLVAGIAVSTYLAATLHVAGESGGRAYYGTDARLAEPFVGALLAVLYARRESFVRLGRRAMRALSAAGAIALVGLVVLVTQLSIGDPRLYQGGFLLAAVLTAVLLVALTQPTAIARAISAAPLVRAGTMSYGVYLFHWPIFQLVEGKLPDANKAVVIAIEVGLTFALAAVSHALLESPIRRRRSARTPIFAAGWFNASVVSLAALVIVTSTPIAQSAATTVHAVDLGSGVDDPVPPPPVVVTMPQAAPPVEVARDGSAQIAAPPPTVVAQPEPQPLTPEEAAVLSGDGDGGGGDDWSSNRTSEPPSSAQDQLRVAVIGDSLAHNLAVGLTDWARDRTDVVVYDLSVSFCPLSRGGERRWEENESFTVNKRCAWWADPDSERARNLAAFAPNVILDEAAFSEMLDRRRPEWERWMRPGDAEYHEWLVQEYGSMSSMLSSLSGVNPAFLNLNIPCGDFSRPKGWDRVSVTRERVAALDQSFYPRLTGVAGDLFSQLCPNGEYSDDLWGIHDARPDGMHLTEEAATELARRWLGPMVLQAGGRTGSAVLAGPVPGA